MTLVDELAAAGIGTTYNQYADSELRRERLTRYLESRAEAPILLVPFGLAWSVLSWLARLPLVAFTSLFLPPWIEAQRESGPTIHMIWRARNRFVGPKVLDEIAANVRRGDYRTQVANATFEGFGA